MLYQTWESAPLYYQVFDPGYPGYLYDTGFENSDYAESLTFGTGQVFHIFADKQETVGAHSTVYVYAMMNYRYHPSWRIVVYAIHGKSGEILWKDVDSWRLNLFMVGLVSNYMVDLDQRTWISHAYGHVYRCLNFNEETKENNLAKKPGMPDFNFYDIRIENDEWLSAEGNPMSGHGVDRVFAVLPSQNRVLARYHDDTAGTPTSFANDKDRYLGVFDYTSKRLLADLKVPGNLLRCVAVDSTTVYGIHSGGMVSVIDYKYLRVRGVIYSGPTTGIGGVSRWAATGYDPVYRRLIAAAPSPDAEDGASTTTLKAFAPREIPIGMLDPIPQQIPRKGRTIGFFSRVYGDGGHGVPGIKVSAEITSGGNNTVNPSHQISDANGHVFFQYTCNDAGSDIDDIQLTAEFEASDPNFTPSDNPTVTIDAPDAVGNEAYFEPGHWGWSEWSNATPAQKWDAFLNGYAVGEHPLRGIVQEYAWTDFEYDISQFNWAKAQADADYLAARGLKLMIAMKLKSPDDETPWVPEDMLDYEQPPEPETPEEEPIEPLLPQSLQELPVTNMWACVIHLEETQGQGLYPIIWHPRVATRFKTLLISMTTHFFLEDTVVGYFPLGTDTINYQDLYAAGPLLGGSISSLQEARRDILTFATGLTGKMIWDICQGDGFGSSRWYGDNGVHFTTDNWSITDQQSYLFGAFTRQVYQKVATGFRIAATDWGQLNCQGQVATPLEFVFSSAGMFNEDPPCSRNTPIYSGYFWFGFYDLVEPEYSLAEEGIEAMATDKEFYLVDAYRGG